MGQEPSPTSEFVWQYFTVGEDKENFLDKLPAPSSPEYLKATCTVCDTTLKRGTDRKTLTTYPLKRHLQTLHPNVWEGLNQYLEQKTRRGVGAFPNSISSDNEKIEEVDPLTSPSTFNARTKSENNEKIEKMTTNTPTSTIQIRHSALKLEKNVQFQKYKSRFFAISKMAKIQFKTTKNAIFGPFFLVQKLIFAIFENANNVFLYF